MVGERDEQIEFLVGRNAAAERLIEGKRPEEVSGRVPHRNEEGVLGIPRVRMRLALPVWRIARAERVPVDGTVRYVVGAAALEARVEQHDEVRSVARGAEEGRPCVFVSMHDRDLEVVPRGPVEVHRDRAEAEGLADRPRNRVEQGRKILPRPQKAGHLKEAPQR